MVYHNVTQSLYGGEREEALAVMDDDAKFDRWMADYERKKAQEMAEIERSRNPTKGGKGVAGRTPVSKEEFLERMNAVNG